MIERYSRPEMKQVWSDENKFNKWLEVEIAVCEAWAEVGVIPRNAIPKIKMAKVNFKRMEEILKETRHDVTAFLGSIAGKRRRGIPLYSPRPYLFGHHGYRHQPPAYGSFRYLGAGH